MVSIETISMTLSTIIRDQCVKSAPTAVTGSEGSSVAAKSISTAPGWDTSPSQVASQHFVRVFLFAWVAERGTVRVISVLPNTPARARTLDLQVSSPTH